MSDLGEKRKHPRLSVDGRYYGIRFRAQGIPIHDSRLVNISAGGCGLEIQMADARYLDVGDLMDSIFLDHPDLPFVPLSAVVMRMLGKVAGKTGGYVLVGLEFQEITPFIQGLIADHVAERLNQE